MTCPIVSRLEKVTIEFLNFLNSGYLNHFEEIPLENWECQLDQLRSWTTKKDLVLTPGFSLEYWLRDSPHIEVHLQWLIEGLENIFIRLSRLLMCRQSSQETNPNTNKPLEEHNPSSNTVHAELCNILDDLCKATKSLNRMQAVIQRPSPHSRLSGISKAYMESFELSDKQYVGNNFPHAKQELIDRLGNAISKRRAFLKLWNDDESGVNLRLPIRMRR